MTLKYTTRLGLETQNTGACFQWVTYTHDNGNPDEQGYRFIWRRPDDSLQAARGQARIPSIADIHTLMAMAGRAGWLGTAESVGAPGEMTRPITEQTADADE